jgi:hypothetical protein
MQSRLLAVQGGSAKHLDMIFVSFMTLAVAIQPAAPPDSPVIFSAEQQRDIACVAVLAMASAAQSRGDDAVTLPADLPINAKRWTVLVGERVMQQSGAPKELVAIAMTEAAKAEQAAALSASDPKLMKQGRINSCVPIMQADLLADAPLPKPLPKPQSAKSGAKK